MASRSCESRKYSLGIFPLIPKYKPYPIDEKNAGLFDKFCMANGVEMTDKEEAKEYLLERDHQQIHQLKSKPYSNRMFGSIFLPPIFLSKVPYVLIPDQYEEMRELVPQAMPDDSGELPGDITERELFHGLHAYFQGQATKDDALILHGHAFLMGNNLKEKVHISACLTKMLTEKSFF